MKKRATQLLKIDIETSNKKLFFIKHRDTGSEQAKWYLVQVDMDKSDPVTTRDYGVYQCQWYTRHHKDCTKYPIMECRFGPDIREIQKDGTLGNMWTVRPLQVDEFLKKCQGYVWYQYDTPLAYHRLVGPLQFGTTGIKKLKYPNMIDDKQWKELEK